MLLGVQQVVLHFMNNVLAHLRFLLDEANLFGLNGSKNGPTIAWLEGPLHDYIVGFHQQFVLSLFETDRSVVNFVQVANDVPFLLEVVFEQDLRIVLVLHLQVVLLLQLFGVHHAGHSPLDAFLNGLHVLQQRVIVPQRVLAMRVALFLQVIVLKQQVVLQRVLQGRGVVASVLEDAIVHVRVLELQVLVVYLVLYRFVERLPLSVGQQVRVRPLLLQLILSIFKHHVSLLMAWRIVLLILPLVLQVIVMIVSAAVHKPQRR